MADGSCSVGVQHIKNSFAQLYKVYVDQKSKASSHNETSIGSGDNNSNSVDVGVRGLSNCSIVASELLELEHFLNENCTSNPSKSDLELYLDAPILSNQKILEIYGGNFDVLVWWKDNEGQYPILAMMARDIMGIPISTVSSESAFSTGVRILDSYRSSLKPSTVESLICCQDWLRQQLEVAQTLDENFSTMPLAQMLDTECSNEGEDRCTIMVDGANENAN